MRCHFVRARSVAAAAILAGVVACTNTGFDTAAQTPSIKLVVLIVVDQMRADYLNRFDRFWTSGIRRLLNEGAVFERAAYPYLLTVTCAGHATIGTGSLPPTHGIVQNEWWNRRANRREACTEDRNATSVAYRGQPEALGHSAHRLRVPTLADRLRERWPDSRGVTLSLKARSAIMLAGRAGSPAWFSATNAWSTSSAFRPEAAVQAFVARRPPDADRTLVWNRVQPADDYPGVDTGIGEKPPHGWSASFPHVLANGDSSTTDPFLDRWERSPFSDQYLGDMASTLVRDLKLGQRDTVDFLGISFSALDYIGHDFGPDSHEVQDALIRLDHTIGALLEALDRTVGKDRYVLAFSSDHGVSPIPEQLTAKGEDAGRIVKARLQKTAEDALTAAHGPGPHVAHIEYTDLYLTDTARMASERTPRFLQPLIAAVSKLPGVLRAIPTAGLEHKHSSADPVERAVALSYFPGESGDVVIVPKPFWLHTATSQASHGTHHPYDQQVPVIVIGPSVKSGRYSGTVTPADIAPTLAHLVNVHLPDATGRVLSEAVK